MLKLLDVLDYVSVINRDDGKRFTDDGRLQRISSLLWDSVYRRVNSDGLFHLYAMVPWDQLRGQDVAVVSTHVDCEQHITRCFSESCGDGLLRGTYDNSITNAAILSLMLEGTLPGHVLIAFTGDEEKDCRGAKHLIRTLRGHATTIRHLFVLDVTDMGWNEKADFTIENDFWHEDFGRRIVRLAEGLSREWRFIPSDPYDIPAFVPVQRVVYEEAEEDESWYYDEEGVKCCSICLPIRGRMHSDDGVLARETSLVHYIEMLRAVLSLSWGRPDGAGALEHGEA